jgi:tripartite-type tricarboxylate transporter receptor subunit TctC
VTSAAGQITGGAVTPLAVTASERLADYANVPTFKELGYDLVATNWFGLAGPAGLPKDIVEKVNREINIGMTTPEAQQRMRRDGMISQPMNAEQFTKFIADGAAIWKPVILKAGIKME